MQISIKDSILYEDSEILVYRKPAGAAVQTRNYRQKDIYSELMNYLAGKSRKPYIGIIHRLDQPVEGVMVFAKTKEAAASLNKQMQKNGFGKYYLAVVRGTLPAWKGTLENYLLKDGNSNTSTVVRDKTAGAKRAVLTYEVLAEKEGQSLVRIQLETGRHHQIRVQMAHAGCPLAGDKKYGGAEENEQKASVSDSGVREVPLALCSVKISFLHPKTGKRMTFEIEPAGEAFSCFT